MGAEGSFFIILVSLIKSLAEHFTCLMLFHVFSVLPVPQYFCKIFLQVLQGLLVHLSTSDTYFPFLLSSTIQSFMAGGVCLLFNHIKQKKYRANYKRLYYQWIGSCKMVNMLRKGIKFSMPRVYFPQSYFKCRPHSKCFKCIVTFKSLTFQLRAIWFHTFTDDMTVVICEDTLNNTHLNPFRTIFIFTAASDL